MWALPESNYFIAAPKLWLTFPVVDRRMDVLPSFQSYRSEPPRLPLVVERGRGRGTAPNATRISHCALAQSLRGWDYFGAACRGQRHEKWARRRKGWHPLKIMNHISISNRITRSALKLPQPPEQHTAELRKTQTLMQWLYKLIVAAAIG